MFLGISRVNLFHKMSVESISEGIHINKFVCITKLINTLL